MTEEEARSRFGFLLEALEYGTPPHGGIALGLDRIVMVLAGADSLCEVISLPQNRRREGPNDGSTHAGGGGAVARVGDTGKEVGAESL